MRIIFVDWTPIENRSMIDNGGKVRRFFVYNMLKKHYHVVPIRKSTGKINFKAVPSLFYKDSKIWVEYGCGRVSHILVILSTLVSSNSFVLNVHDLSMQEKHFNKRRNLTKEIQLYLIEKMLLKRAGVVILAWPGMLNFFNPKPGQKVIVMPPGIEKEELYKNIQNCTGHIKTALYFGGMKRKDIIPTICNLFTNLEEWKLDLAGLKEGENIDSYKNIHYLGSLPHVELNAIINKYDVILLPLPRNKYTEFILPMKTCYALNSCKPIIMSRLPGLINFVSEIGLSSNVIFIDNWDEINLKRALDESLTLNIDYEKTQSILAKLDWENRFDELKEIIYDDKETSSNNHIKTI